MGKKSKTKKGGKLYDDDPECQYLVVENPWPNWDRETKAANWPRYFNHIGAWLWYASNRNPNILPEELYHVGTRDDVVIRYAKDADVSSLLGAHNWRQFDARESPSPVNVSYIFVFDYGTKGHPDHHQWSSHSFSSFLEDVHLANGSLPVKQPYPSPEWADCRGRMRSCRDLALPMAKSRVSPPREESMNTSSAQLQSTSVLTAIASLLPDRPRPPPPPEPPARDPSKPLPGKIDPGYEDDMASRVLKGGVVKQEVKAEQNQASLAETEAAYQRWKRSQQEERSTNAEPIPSQEIVNLDGHTVQTDVKQEEAFAKHETRDDAQDELAKMFEKYSQHLTQSETIHVNGHAQATQPTLPQSSSCKCASRVKTESSGNSQYLSSGQGTLQVKQELMGIGTAIDHQQSLDPRANTVHQVSRIKRELESSESVPAKRVKTE